jgi:AcrR family transcriptional regulator
MDKRTSPQRRTALAQSPRRRLSPEVRRDLLLDAAATIITAEGVSAVTMERVGLEAGVSKALAYAYFGNRTTLLAALLLREYPAFASTPSDQPEAKLEDVIRATTIDYLFHVAEKGELLQRLLAEPAVVDAVADHHRLGRQNTAQFFGALMSRDFGISPELAVCAADMLMGVTGAAGRILSRGGPAADRDELSELVTQIIMAAVRELASDPAITDEGRAPR